MSVVWWALAGYLGGALPTADWLARRRGIDLRSSGSGNPGANNARRTGGIGLGLTVLAVEIAKGALLAAGAHRLGGQTEAVTCAVAAVAGNIVNPWFRFRGGQGLGITAGVLLGVWPGALTPALLVIGVVALLTRSSPVAALAAVATLATLGWTRAPVPEWWGVDPSHAVLLAFGLVVTLTPKQIRNLWRDRGRRPETASRPA